MVALAVALLPLTSRCSDIVAANSSELHPAACSGFRAVLRMVWCSWLIGGIAVLVPFAMQRGNGSLAAAHGPGVSVRAQCSVAAGFS
ncbi:MAG: hypothetical protein ACOY3E_11100 [Pseudomonadota bacterium]